MPAVGMIVKMNIRKTAEMSGVNGIQLVLCREMNIELRGFGITQDLAKIEVGAAIGGKINAPDVALPSRVAMANQRPGRQKDLRRKSVNFLRLNQRPKQKRGVATH